MMNCVFIDQSETLWRVRIGFLSILGLSRLSLSLSLFLSCHAMCWLVLSLGRLSFGCFSSPPVVLLLSCRCRYLSMFLCFFVFCFVLSCIIIAPLFVVFFGRILLESVLSCLSQVNLVLIVSWVSQRMSVSIHEGQWIWVPDAEEYILPGKVLICRVVSCCVLWLGLGLGLGLGLE